MSTFPAQVVFTRHTLNELTDETLAYSFGLEPRNEKPTIPLPDKIDVQLRIFSASQFKSLSEETQTDLIALSQTQDFNRFFIILPDNAHPFSVYDNIEQVAREIAKKYSGHKVHIQFRKGMD